MNYSNPSCALGFISNNQGVISSSSTVCAGAEAPISCVAFGFTAEETGDLTEISLSFSTNTGAPTDVRVSIYADNGAGSPNAVGAIVGSESLGITAVSGWNSFTMPNVPLQRGARYHAVVKDYTPSTSIALSYMAGGAEVFRSSNMNTWGFTRHITTTGEGGWGTGSGAVLGIWGRMASGSIIGSPYTYSPLNRTTSGLYGNLITIPKHLPTFSCKGVYAKLARTTPLPDVSPKIKIIGRGLSSYEIPSACLQTSFGCYAFMFEQPVLLYGGERVRVCLDLWGSATNCIRETHLKVDPRAYESIPYNMIATKSTDGGATWTETPGEFSEMVLLGEPQNEFRSPPINRRTSTGR